MCGRFTLGVKTAEVAETFQAAQRGLDLPPSYNIAPTQNVLIVRRDQSVGERELAEARWGLIPHWVNDSSGFKMTLINARSETAAKKPSFRGAFRSRRCLIPADGFYEWLKLNGGKQPYMVHRKDDGLFAFAGLWGHWESEDGASLESCTILTCEPDDVAGEIHDPMPVM